MYMHTYSVQVLGGRKQYIRFTKSYLILLAPYPSTHVRTRTLDSTLYSYMYISILTYTGSAYNARTLGENEKGREEIVGGEIKNREGKEDMGEGRYSSIFNTTHIWYTRSPTTESSTPCYPR